MSSTVKYSNEKNNLSNSYYTIEILLLGGSRFKLEGEKNSDRHVEIGSRSQAHRSGAVGGYASVAPRRTVGSKAVSCLCDSHG